MTGAALIVGGGGLQGLPVLRALQAMGWKAVVADSIANNINRFEADAYYVAPPVARQEEFSDFLLSLVTAEQIKAVFPTTMYDLPVLAEMRPQLERLGVHVFASSSELISTLQDKERATEEARLAGLPTLPSIDPENHDFAFPLIGKPRLGWGGRDIVHVESRSQVRDAVPAGSLREYIWQRRIDGFREWSVDFAVDSAGRISDLVKRQRVRASGGYAVISEVAESGGPAQEAIAAAQWLARSGALGIFNVQFLEEGDGFWLTDINPRPGTSSISALGAGVNLVEFLLTGRDNPARGGLLVRTLQDSFIATGLSGVRGVVFDLDETIIDQKSWMVSKLEIVLANVSDQLTDIEVLRTAVLQIIDEGPWDRLIDVAVRRARLPAEFADKMIEAWRDAWPSRIHVHSDAQGLAEDLARKKVPIAIVSDNPARSQRQKLKRLAAPWNTAHVVLTDDLSAPKPATQGFLRASEDLDIEPSDLVFIGDSPWRDAVGALRAGYRAAVVVQRPGAMHNSNRSLFEARFPEYAKRISWLRSLAGLGHLIESRKN